MRVEATIDVPAERVWEAVADVAAVHRHLLPGRVADVPVEGGRARSRPGADGPIRAGAPGRTRTGDLEILRSRLRMVPTATERWR
jgi:uncharacterized protein YndB with AHSA1/START domain